MEAKLSFIYHFKSNSLLMGSLKTQHEHSMMLEAFEFRSLKIVVRKNYYYDGKISVNFGMVSDGGCRISMCNYYIEVKNLNPFNQGGRAAGEINEASISLA